MSDTYTTVTHTSFGSRLIGSFAGIILGPLLFFSAFFVLFWNEGRVDMSKIAETAFDITASTEVSEYAGKLVSYTGTVTSSELLGDTYLADGPYLVLQMKVEMYAWVEESASQTETNVGGSQDTTITYTYKKEWVENPQDSSTFAQSENHTNPEMAETSTNHVVSVANIGEYAIDIKNMTIPDSDEAVSLVGGNAREVNGFLEKDGYVYRGNGTVASPEVGDMRISYSALKYPLQRATVFGMLSADGTAIDGYYEGSKKLYYLARGSREDGIAEMQMSHMIVTWILRVVGFVMMFVGLMMFVSPITTFLDILPFAGSIGRGMFGVVSFVLSMVLTIVTILVSMFLHTILAVAVACVVATIVVFALFMRKNKSQNGDVSVNVVK